LGFVKQLRRVEGKVRSESVRGLDQSQSVNYYCASASILFLVIVNSQFAATKVKSMGNLWQVLTLIISVNILGPKFKTQTSS